MSIVVEESEVSVLELGELFFTGVASIILQFIVQKVDWLWFEKGSNFRILMDDISQMYFVDIRIESFVSNSGPEKHPRKNG